MRMPTISIDMTRLRRAGRFASTRFGWLDVLEYALLALVAMQGARVFWALLLPVGALGGWTPRQPVIPSATQRAALFASFDPFFRSGQAEAGNRVVTSLALTLFGIRLNEGSGLGSAIIATPDGVQNSIAVGEEILPGVTLKAVAFDHVVIDRGGAEETVFLDQSQSAPIADPEENEGGAPVVGSSGPPSNPVRQSLSAVEIKAGIGFAPRLENGRVTGLVLSPKGPAFEAAGFQPGDIVTQVNGRTIGSAGDLQTLQGQIAPGARLSLMVERGASTVPIALIVQGQ